MTLSNKYTSLNLIIILSRRWKELKCLFYTLDDFSFIENVLNNFPTGNTILCGFRVEHYYTGCNEETISSAFLVILKRSCYYWKIKKTCLPITDNGVWVINNRLYERSHKNYPSVWRNIYHYVYSNQMLSGYVKRMLQTWMKILKNSFGHKFRCDHHNKSL